MLLQQKEQSKIIITVPFRKCPPGRWPIPKTRALCYLAISASGLRVTTSPVRMQIPENISSRMPTTNCHAGRFAFISMKQSVVLALVCVRSLPNNVFLVKVSGGETVTVLPCRCPKYKDPDLSVTPVIAPYRSKGIRERDILSRLLTAYQRRRYGDGCLADLSTLLPDGIASVFWQGKFCIALR